MTALEDRLRTTLHDMADEAQPAPLLTRLERESVPSARRHRLALAAVAAAVVAVVATASLFVLRLDKPRTFEPVDHPPKVFRLSDRVSESPGRADLAVTLAPGEHDDDKPAYLQGSTGAEVVVLTPSSDFDWTWTQHLSSDGTRLVRQASSGVAAGLEIIDLRNGDSVRVVGARGYCPALSPDNATLAYYSSRFGGQVLLTDVHNGSSSMLRTAAFRSEVICGGLAWSPEGDLLAIRDAKSSVIVDRDGRVVRRIPGGSATNGSMSWSPDGSRILIYDAPEGRFVVLRLAEQDAVALPRPPGGVEPIGWTGDRVVWLVGQPGAQSLQTTDEHGSDARTWMRFEVGGSAVEAVQWSRDLSGGPAD